MRQPDRERGPQTSSAAPGARGWRSAPTSRGEPDPARPLASSAPDVDAALARGLVALEAGAWFAAHEAFEDAWRALHDGPARLAAQALVHAATARELSRRGRPDGARRQAGKAHARAALGAPALGPVTDVAATVARTLAAEPGARGPGADDGAGPRVGPGPAQPPTR